jgi:carotenoid cleavage dioxygenase-like enzyme
MGHADLLNDVPTLSGAFAPVDRECVITDALEIEGEVPADLNGLYVRTGPNRRFAAPGRYHWFDGDGMLHAVRFDRGRIEYRNRWVMPDGLQEELAAGQALWQGIKDPPRRVRSDSPMKNTSNTDVKYFGGSLISMWYLGGDVYRCDPFDLSTLGKLSTDPRLAGVPISAHSRVDERTGELMFFAYGKTAPYMHYGVLDRHGALKTFIPIALPGPRLPHDMAITPHYSVLHDLPLFQDDDALAAGRHKLKFYGNNPARFAVVPRHGSAEQIRWFEASPTYLYHVSNAWEEADGQGGVEIVMTGTPFRIPRDAQGAFMYDEVPRLTAQLVHDFYFHEWRFNLRTGRTRERVIDDVLNSEFPVINSWMQGFKTRYSWHTLMGPSVRAEEPRFCGVVKYDLQRGSCQTYHEGPNKWWSEAPFAPRKAPRDVETAEDDGYLVGFVWDGDAQKSKVVVMDAANVSAGPVCRITLPVRVPNGFHATWVSDARLKRGY